MHVSTDGGDRLGSHAHSSFSFFFNFFLKTLNITFILISFLTLSFYFLNFNGLSYGKG